MGKYIIAGIKTEYEPKFSLLRERSKAYEADFPDGETQIRIKIKDEFLKKQQAQFPNLSMEEHEYMWTGEAFYIEALRYGGIVLHSSCVEKDGQAYLFSAKSGIGKSTHTHLWLTEIPNTRIINDDSRCLYAATGKSAPAERRFRGKPMKT